MYPPGYSLENKLEPRDQRWKPHPLLPICRGALDGIFSQSSPLRPDLLVSGYFTALETLLIRHKYSIPGVTITTYLRHPSEDPAMHAKMKLIYMPRAFSRALIKSVRPDKPDMSFEEFVQPLESQQSPELIPCPREFDFADEDWNHRSNVFYVEPMILRTALGPPTGPSPAPLDVRAGTPLIFATSGSQVQDYESRAREFFKNLIAMMQTQGMGSYHLVAAVGSKLLLELTEEYSGTNSLPSNITLYDWVSQLNIFGSDDLRAVYMHGGLATIKEAIWKKVPIVIVPHGKDQLDNSLRLGRKGLGVVAQQDGLSPLNLRKLLTAATTSNWIKNSLTTMQGIMAVDEDKPAAQKPSVLKIQAVLGL